MDQKGKLTDEELLQQLRSGTERNEAIRYMYDNYAGSLTNFITNNNGSTADAEDIFQEVLVNFITLVQAGKFRGESSVKTFIFSMNRFAWLNELKRRGRAGTRELNFEKLKETEEADVSHAMIKKETSGEITMLVGSLGETCRKILLMFYYEDRSMKEILAYTGYENEQVVRNKKYKCLKQLEKMINEKPAMAETLKNMLNG